MFKDGERKRKIVVCEDDPMYRASLASALEQRGFVVSAYSTPAEISFEALKQSAPDIISLDVSMPKMTGFTFLEQIRKDTLLSETPCVFITSMGDEESVAHGRLLGCQGYFIKYQLPISIIAQKIDDLIKVSSV